MYLLTITKTGELNYQWLTLNEFIKRNQATDYHEKHLESKIAKLLELRSGLWGQQPKTAYNDMVDCIMLDTQGKDPYKALVPHFSELCTVNCLQDNCLKQPYESPETVTFFTTVYEASGQVKASMYKVQAKYCANLLRPLKLLKMGI